MPNFIFSLRVLTFFLVCYNASESILQCDYGMPNPEIQNDWSNGNNQTYYMAHEDAVYEVTSMVYHGTTYFNYNNTGCHTSISDAQHPQIETSNHNDSIFATENQNSSSFSTGLNECKELTESKMSLSNNETVTMNNNTPILHTQMKKVNVYGWDRDNVTNLTEIVSQNNSNPNESALTNKTIENKSIQYKESYRKEFKHQYAKYNTPLQDSYQNQHLCQYKLIFNAFLNDSAIFYFFVGQELEGAVIYRLKAKLHFKLHDLLFNIMGFNIADGNIPFFWCEPVENLFYTLEKTEFDYIARRVSILRQIYWDEQHFGREKIVSLNLLNYIYDSNEGQQSQNTINPSFAIRYYNAIEDRNFAENYFIERNKLTANSEDRIKGHNRQSELK